MGANIVIAALGISVVLSISLIVAWALWTVVYRAFLHPFAKYPGPFLAKFTNFYAAYHAWTGDIHRDIRRCHDIYGSRVRYAPNRLLFDDDRAVNEIYGLKSRMTKSRVYDALVHKAPNTLTLRNKAEHLRRRRIMSQGFSDSALRKFESDVRSFISVLCNQIKRAIPTTLDHSPKAWSTPQDMSQWFDRLTFDIMSKVIFSASSDTLQQEKLRYVTDAIAASNVRVGTVLQSPELATRKLDKKLFPRAIQARNEFVPFISKTLQDRLKKANEPKSDIFFYFQDATDPETGAKLSMPELSAETATLIVAGSDTSSTAMAASLFYILQDKQSYASVVQEVRAAFASPEEITGGTKLVSCKYLRACIDEALRLAPPAGGPLWRQVPDEGATVGGVFIPGGLDVGVGVYSIHHNAAYFPDPYRFNPQRWGGSGRTTSAYMPFSLGQRSCIGKSLALNEVTLALARLFWEFEIEAADKVFGDNAQFVLHDHVTGAKDPFPVRFRYRQD